MNQRFIGWKLRIWYKWYMPRNHYNCIVRRELAGRLHSALPSASLCCIQTVQRKTFQDQSFSLNHVFSRLLPLRATPRQLQAFKGNRTFQRSRQTCHWVKNQQQDSEIWMPDGLKWFLGHRNCKCNDEPKKAIEHGHRVLASWQTHGCRWSRWLCLGIYHCRLRTHWPLFGILYLLFGTLSGMSLNIEKRNITDF